MIKREDIVAKLAEWSDTEWEGVHENFMEYRAALGPEATKSLEEFAWGIAAQNVLYQQLREIK